MYTLYCYGIYGVYKTYKEALKNYNILKQKGFKHVLSIEKMEYQTMEKSELEVIYDATSTLNKMCNINHDFSKTLVEEMKTLVKIVTQMEKRIQNLEAK